MTGAGDEEMEKRRFPGYWAPHATGALLLIVTGLGISDALVAHRGDRTRVHACVNQSNGTIRIVAANGSCRAHENALDWNITGPQGPAGPRGPAGPQGPI